jgi:serine/threonine-protein kinase
MAVPFDLDRMALKGQPVSLIPNVMQTLNARDSVVNTLAGQFAVSDSGSLAFAPGGIFADEENSLVWVDQKGAERPITSARYEYLMPHLSPDGQRIVFRSARRLWIYDLARGTASPVTSADEGYPAFPIWSTDGKRVAFNWTRSFVPNLYWQAADGSSSVERLTSSDFWQAPESWSPDGGILAFTESSWEGGADILLLDLRSRRVRPFLNSAFLETDPSFSPDGRWLAYVSNESGQSEIYVRGFPGPGGKWRISSEGGRRPVWARDGRELFYSWGDQLWVADVQTGSNFSAGPPRLLLERPGWVFGDVSLDGQRFLMVKLGERKPSPVTELILVQNWFEELKRLVPTGK